MPVDDDGLTKQIDWDEGADSPKCASGGSCGGRLCTGYYCTPNPKGHTPDFRDPKDPNKDGEKPSTTSAPRPTTATAKPSETTHEEGPPDNYCIKLWVKNKTTTGGGIGSGTVWYMYLEYNGEKVCDDNPTCEGCDEQEVKCDDGFAMKVIVSEDPAEYTDVVISFPGTKNKTVRLDGESNGDDCNFSKSSSLL